MKTQTPGRLIISMIVFSLLTFLQFSSPGQCPEDLCPPARPCDLTLAELNATDVTLSIPNRVSIKVGGYWRTITSNGIPNHNIGIFPAFGCGRPDTIKEQHHTYVIPAFPKGTYYFINADDTYTEVPELTPFGIAVNGIPLDPEAAEWYKCNPETGWQINPLTHPDMEGDLDGNNGHVQPQGGENYSNYDTYFDDPSIPNEGPYHYHALPNDLYRLLGGTYPWKFLNKNGEPRAKRAKTVLLGWGFDGYPVYGPTCWVEDANPGQYDYWIPLSGYEIKDRPSIDGVLIYDPCAPTDAYTGNYVNDFEYIRKPYHPDFPPLDKCNGHYAPTPQNPEGIYHYHITVDYKKTGYPYIPRCYRKKILIDGPSAIKVGF